MPTLLSTKYGFYFYKDGEDYVVQIDSGDIVSHIFQFTITESDYHEMQKSREKAIKVMDRSTKKVLKSNQGWDVE